MQEGTDPAVLIPLPQRGSPHALLVLRGRSPQFATDPGRLQIAKIFGDLVSIALENADMFERVSSSQREWENTFDSIADPIYIVDNEYRLKKMNKSLASYAMQSIKLPQGQFCYQHIYHRNTICPWCPVPKMMQTGLAVQWKLQCLRTDCGKFKHFHLQTNLESVSVQSMFCAI